MLRLQSGGHPRRRHAPPFGAVRSRHARAVLVLTIASLAGGVSDVSVVRAQPAMIEEGAAQRRIVVTLNKSRTFKMDRAFASAVVGSPDIADVLPMSDRSLYVQGKKVGTTNVSVFDQGMRLVAVFDVEVAIDTENLSHKINATTQSRGIRVTSDNGQVVLSGEARDAVAADRAVSIAKGMTPNVPVINTMRVAPSQQVMLRVRFLEVSRDAERSLGVNWYGANRSGTRGVNTGLGEPTQVGQSPVATPGGLPLFQTIGTFAGSSSAPFGVALANLVRNGTSIDVLITALESKGVVRRLAEPDLVALSGDTASFLAGGEIPIPIVQGSIGGSQSISIEYKPFGVQLTFIPTVLANGIINLRMAPSVSELDFNNAVVISGFSIPALTKREARTTIELRDGQSFAIAGLLQTEGLRNIAQVPWLGSVPVLGALFRSASYQKSETDLVVIVTPHLVDPAVPGDRLATPMDQRMPSNDLDFFLIGQPETRKRYTDFVVAGQGVQGPYGHMLPVQAR